MRTKFALIAAIASFLLVAAVGTALAGAETTGPSGPSGPTGPVESTPGTTLTPPPPAPACSNGVDDDGDGLVDMEDPDCESPEDTTEEPTSPASQQPTEGEAVSVPQAEVGSHTRGNL